MKFDKIFRAVGFVIALIMGFSTITLVITGDLMLSGITLVLTLGYSFMFYIHDSEVKANLQFEDELEVCNA